MAITAWWLSQDQRVPDFDTGNHLFDAFTIHDEIVAGHLLAPFTDWNSYPPLGHVVGALGTLVAGVGEWQAILAQNLVFVPLLAMGCYGVARLAAGPVAGLLAVVFALGTPMLDSQFHAFLLDAPEAAMVAVSAWAILASDRFRRVSVSALAGAAVGLGMLTKQTFVIFVAGLLLVVLLRGGWRNWRGLITFAAVAAALALPWYLYHFGQLHGLTQGAAGASPSGAANGAAASVTPPRFSRHSIGWYFWNLVNLQLLVPLAVFFLVGTAAAVARYTRRPRKQDLAPELFVAGLVSYVGMTYITLKDPRYTLPALVYMAALGSVGITLLRPRWRLMVGGLLGAVALMNTVAVSFGVGTDVRVTLGGAPTASFQRSFTFYSPAGYVRGGPQHDGDVLDLMRSLRREGVRVVAFDGGSADALDFNFAGLRTFARIANLTLEPGDNLSALTAHDVFMLRRAPQWGDPPPCQRFEDGTGLYLEFGNPLRYPFEQSTLYCPGRRPRVYRRTAPLPATITHVVTGEPRRALLHLMRALRRAQVRVVEFDAVSMVSPYMDLIGLTRLAQSVGIARPPVYAPTKLGAHDAFLLRHTLVPTVAPCAMLPDGSGIYVVLGNPVIPFKKYQFFCPTRTPQLQRASQ